MCAKTRFTWISLVAYLAVSIAANGCASQIFSQFKGCSDNAPAPQDQVNEASDEPIDWKPVVKDATAMESKPEYEPDLSKKYKWIVNSEFPEALPPDVTVRVAVRDTLVVLEYTVMVAAIILGHAAPR